MKKIIDTQAITNPNEFGEIMREYCFVDDDCGGDFGCYTTFDTKDGFVEVDEHSKERALVLRLFCGTKPTNKDDIGWWSADRENIKNRLHIFTNGRILMAWYWDGDGTLLFREKGRVAINTDCKKTYGWKWIK